MHLSWIVLILLSGQIQINAIHFPIVIPRIMIKIPMAFVSLIGEAPRRDNACLYDSDKVSVPFVSSLICDSWHSDVVLSPWMPLLTVICFKYKEGKKKKKADRFITVGRLVRATQGLLSHPPQRLKQEKNNVIPPLANIWFEYVHLSTKGKTPKVSLQNIFLMKPLE